MQPSSILIFRFWLKALKALSALDSSKNRSKACTAEMQPNETQSLDWSCASHVIFAGKPRGNNFGNNGELDRSFSKFEMLPLLPMDLIKAICVYNVFCTVCIISSLRMGVYSTVRISLRRDLSRVGIKTPVRTEIVSVLHITNVFGCSLMCM